MFGYAVNIIVHMFVAANIQISQSCPMSEISDAKAAYKSGEVTDQTAMPITLDKIKTRLKESEIFDWQDQTLNDMEKKEMNKLFEAVEIMIELKRQRKNEIYEQSLKLKLKGFGGETTSRSRQPQNVQTLFSSLRLVERVVKKQLKEGQISENLASKFHWDKLTNRSKRERPTYYLDTATNMRMFNMN